MEAGKPAIYIMVLLALQLVGCASMDKSECLTVDWQTVGYEDGVAGRSGERIGQHRKACARHGVAPDLSAYQNGREQGLREFCQPRNGYQLGERGAGYGGFCPADLAPEFDAAYQDGLTLYRMRSRVAQAASDIKAMRDELVGAEDGIVEASAVIVDSRADNAAKTQALLDVKRLSERRGTLKVQIARREEDHLRLQRDLDHYLASAGSR